MVNFTAEKHLKFTNKILMVGFGSIGQAVLPLIFRHLEITPSQVKILSKKEDGMDIAKEYGVHFFTTELTKDNYWNIVLQHLSPGDFLLNLSVDVSSVDLIKLCQQQN